MKIHTPTSMRCRPLRPRNSSKSARTRISTRTPSGSPYAVAAISRRSLTNSTHREPPSTLRTISLSNTVNSSSTKPTHRQRLHPQLSNTTITTLTITMHKFRLRSFIHPAAMVLTVDRKRTQSSRSNNNSSREISLMWCRLLLLMETIINHKKRLNLWSKWDTQWMS